MKKIVLILAVFLLTLTGCVKERVEDISKLELRDKKVYVIGETKPYTGTFIGKDENGNLQIEGMVKNGKLNGIVKIYYENGQLCQELKYENGIQITSTHEKERVENVTRMNTIDGKYYVGTEHIPYTGKLVMEFTGDASLAEWDIKDGLMEGMERVYYKSGQLWSELTYKKGEAYGTKRTYYEDGKLLKTTEYKNGKLNGLDKTYHKNGKLRTVVRYKNDVEVVPKKYFNENGKKISYEEFLKLKAKEKKAKEEKAKEEKVKEEKVKEEKVKEEKVKEKVMSRIEDMSKMEINYGTIYVEGEDKPYTGIFVEKYSNGNLEEILEIENGIIHGENKRYYPSGQLLYRVMLKNGKEEGESKSYYESGKLWSKCFYKDGKAEGFQRKYHENGQLWSEIEYKDDKRIGEMKWYDKNGNPKSSLNESLSD